MTKKKSEVARIENLLPQRFCQSLGVTSMLTLESDSMHSHGRGAAKKDHQARKAAKR